MSNQEMLEAVLDKVEHILEKPRVNSYSPQSLVEVVYSLLSLVYDEYKFTKYMFREYSSTSRPWHLGEGLDYTIVTNRLRKLVDFLKDSDWEI